MSFQSFKRVRVDVSKFFGVGARAGVLKPKAWCTRDVAESAWHLRQLCLDRLSLKLRTAFQMIRHLI